MRGIRIERDVACPFSAAIEYAEDYFRLGPSSERTLSLALPLGPFTVCLQRRVAVETLVGPDPTDLARRHDAMWIWLRPRPGTPFPAFRAILTARPHAPGTHVTFECAYTPPLAFVGRVIDALAGRFVATRIGLTLLDDLAAHLERSYLEFTATCSAPPVPR